MVWILVAVMVLGGTLIALSIVNPFVGLFLILGGVAVVAVIGDRRRRQGDRRSRDVSEILDPARPAWPASAAAGHPPVDASELDPASGGTPWGTERGP